MASSRKIPEALRPVCIPENFASDGDDSDEDQNGDFASFPLRSRLMVCRLPRWQMTVPFLFIFVPYLLLLFLYLSFLAPHPCERERLAVGRAERKPRLSREKGNVRIRLNSND